jgi:hypothetical protein
MSDPSRPLATSSSKASYAAKAVVQFQLSDWYYLAKSTQSQRLLILESRQPSILMSAGLGSELTQVSASKTSRAVSAATYRGHKFEHSSRFLSSLHSLFIWRSTQCPAELEGLSSSTDLMIDIASGGYFSQHYTLLILLMLVLYWLGLVILIVLAAYILGRIKGVIIALVILALPGVCNAFGLFHDINYMPHTSVLRGTGVLGSPWGLLPLVILGLLTGWSLVIILVDIFGVGERFRHYYDHLWYAMAVLAGLFFVADSSAQNDFMDLQEENQNSREASAYLLNQVRDYDRHCQVDSSLGAASCRWAVRVQGLLSQYAAARIFDAVGPKSSADIYDPFRYRISAQEILQIRREIMAYNDSRCPVTVISETRTQNTVSGTCQSPPANICVASADPFDEKTNDDLRWRTVALASECIIPTLVRSRKLQEKYAAIVSHNNRNNHYRWLFFILFSAIVGGKIAIATSQAMRLDKRETAEKHRLWKGAKGASGAAMDNVVAWIKYVPNIFRRLANAARKR